MNDYIVCGFFSLECGGSSRFWRRVSAKDVGEACDRVRGDNKGVDIFYVLGVESCLLKI